VFIQRKQYSLKFIGKSQRTELHPELGEGALKCADFGKPHPSLREPQCRPFDRLRTGNKFRMLIVLRLKNCYHHLLYSVVNRSSSASNDFLRQGTHI